MISCEESSGPMGNQPFDAATSEQDAQTILVVDDSEDIRDLLEVLLESEGYTVLLADSGRAALKTLDTTTPHLILMDMSLPEMDGWTMVPILRTLPQLANLPIIALTAHATPDDEKRALAVGCSGYISKPFDADDFLERIASFLAASNAPTVAAL